MLSQHANKNDKDGQEGSHIVFSLKVSYVPKHLTPNQHPVFKHQ
jgi:hypothetical protein